MRQLRKSPAALWHDEEGWVWGWSWWNPPRIGDSRGFCLSTCHIGGNRAQKQKSRESQFLVWLNLSRTREATVFVLCFSGILEKCWKENQSLVQKDSSENREVLAGCIYHTDYLDEVSDVAEESQKGDSQDWLYIRTTWEPGPHHRPTNENLREWPAFYTVGDLFSLLCFHF